MRRHFEVVRRGLVLEDPTGHVKRGTVAGAEETTMPVVGQGWLRASLQPVSGRAAQVGTDTHADKHFRLDRAVLILGVIRGGISFSIRLGISQLGLGLCKGFQLLGGALEDPYRLAAPLHSDFFSGL